MQRHDGTDSSDTMVPITVLRMVPIQRYRQLSGFGKRDSEISEMTQDAVEHVHKIWYEYVFNRKPKAGTDRLVYDDIKIK